MPLVNEIPIGVAKGRSKTFGINVLNDVEKLTELLLKNKGL